MFLRFGNGLCHGDIFIYSDRSFEKWYEIVPHEKRIYLPHSFTQLESNSEVFVVLWTFELDSVFGVAVEN